jgi:hypothetical protein
MKKVPKVPKMPKVPKIKSKGICLPQAERSSSSAGTLLKAQSVAPKTPLGRSSLR